MRLGDDGKDRTLAELGPHVVPLRPYGWCDAYGDRTRTLASRPSNTGARSKTGLTTTKPHTPEFPPPPSLDLDLERVVIPSLHASFHADASQAALAWPCEPGVHSAAPMTGRHLRQKGRKLRAVRVRRDVRRAARIQRPARCPSLGHPDPPRRAYCGRARAHQRAASAVGQEPRGRAAEPAQKGPRVRPLRLAGEGEGHRGESEWSIKSWSFLLCLPLARLLCSLFVSVLCSTVLRHSEQGSVSSTVPRRQRKAGSGSPSENPEVQPLFVCSQSFPAPSSVPARPFSPCSTVQRIVPHGTDSIPTDEQRFERRSAHRVRVCRLGRVLKHSRTEVRSPLLLLRRATPTSRTQLLTPAYA